MLRLLWKRSSITLSTKKNDPETSVFNRYMVCVIEDGLFILSCHSLAMRSQGGHLWASVFIGYTLNGLEGFVSNGSSITQVP